ncbi:MAG: glutamine synthetase adenylyltransferase [Chloroflexi bacterium]|nr:glutamine synthetase adenylyltransferase [Chloroflexota bacterium]
MADWLDPRLEPVLERLLRSIPSAAIPDRWAATLVHALSTTANPERALLNLDTFSQSVGDAAAFWSELATSPRLLQILLSLFAGSQHLSQVLIRHPEYWPRLVQIPSLAHAVVLQQYLDELQVYQESADDQLLSQNLCRWQGWEMLRIGLCDLAGLMDLTAVTTQLSLLAESLVRICLQRNLKNEAAQGFVILALGKLGGQELNYSSDIDLICLSEHDTIAYVRAAEQAVHLLSQVTSEGFLYRVDMRLRPWGQSGSLVPTRAAYTRYLKQSARLWEKQALLKARPIAGDLAFGAAFLAETQPLLMSCDNEAIRSDVREMKQKIEDDLAEHGRAWGEVKLGRGSIRDVEFVTQYLQLTHCGKHPAILGGNTVNVLKQLRDEKIITSHDYRVLVEGYTFLRPLEHYLQMTDYRQVHILPQEQHELDALARRLGFRGAKAGEVLLARYHEHSEAIRAVYEQQLYGKEAAMTAQHNALEPLVRRHLERLSPFYLETFTAVEIQHHAELIERLNEHNLVEVEATVNRDSQVALTIVGYDFPGELSLICGLLFVHGFSISDGNIFTYEPAENHHEELSREEQRRKIVDVLNVTEIHPSGIADIWQRYHDDLEALLAQVEHGNSLAVQADLASRIAVALPPANEADIHLHPIEVRIDNTSSERYTLLHIEAADTMGFLYELTNALALMGYQISLVTVDSTGQRAHDIIYLTDAADRKVTSKTRKNELTTAVILIKHFTHLLPRSPNPESALLHFRELVAELMRRPDWMHELSSLESPDVLAVLTKLLGVSDFLWDDFLRLQYDSLFPLLNDINELNAVKTPPELEAELCALLDAAPDYAAKREALNRFKDREMFRIDLRHIQELVGSFAQFAHELTDLADVVIRTGIELCIERVAGQYGELRDATGNLVPWCLSALGKCGGRELGYASDIELLFIYSGIVSPNLAISANEYYNKVIVELLNLIQSKHEGIFHIDLQLRPFGSAGSIAVPLESFQRYYAPNGAAWPYERQALIKLRPLAGDSALGEQLLGLRDQFVFRSESLDIQAIRAMRERQVRQLVAGGTLNVKFSPGGTVDAEYLVQTLQIRYGQHNPELRLANTLDAMGALHQAAILTDDQYAQLQESYIFLRRMVDSLRMVRGNTRDLTVPEPGSDEYAYLARRMGLHRDIDKLGAHIAEAMSTIQRLQAQLWAASTL